MDVRTLCLAILSDGEATGYEIKKALESGRFSHFQTATYGSIYPALQRLAEDGLLTATALSQKNRPDKKVYRLTLKGLEALRDGLLRPPAADFFRSDFLFLVMYAHLLPQRRLAALIDSQIDAYRQALADCTPAEAGAAEEPAGARFVRGFGATMYTAALAYLENHRDTLLSRAEPGQAAA
ncbi:MAG: hypothetical protein OHK0024_09290 [Thalassobaculales bacterium]